MKWMKYGITLSRLTENDIELVRYWRNRPEIRNTMIYRKYISKDRQKKWFSSINNNYNYYYLIIYKNEKIGLIHNKNVECKDSSSEAGIFIWNDTYDFVPFLASLLLCEIGFYVLYGGDSYVRVLRSNARAYEYNLLLGYEVIEDVSELDYIRMKLTKESFKLSTEKIRKTMLINTKSDGRVFLVLEPHDYHSGLAQMMEQLYIEPVLAVSPGSIDREDTDGNIIYSGIPNI